MSGWVLQRVAVVARHPISDVRSSGGFDDEHLDREPRLVSCVSRPEPLRVCRSCAHGRTVTTGTTLQVAFLDALAGRIRRWLAEGTHVWWPAI